MDQYWNLSRFFGVQALSMPTRYSQSQQCVFCASYGTFRRKQRRHFVLTFIFSIELPTEVDSAAFLYIKNKPFYCYHCLSAVTQFRGEKRLIACLAGQFSSPWKSMFTSFSSTRNESARWRSCWCQGPAIIIYSTAPKFMVVLYGYSANREGNYSLFNLHLHLR